jgi:hypothetical protein
MGRTTPHSFYEQFVVPNLDDYLKQPDDVRLGFNASVSAFQLADIMFCFYEHHRDRSKVAPWRTLKALHKDLTKRQPLFLTVQSVATVFKHLRPRPGNTFLEVGSPGGLSSIKFSSGTELKTNWRGSRGDVIVRRRNQTKVSLTKALTAVVNDLWPTVLPEEDAGT